MRSSLFHSKGNKLSLRAIIYHRDLKKEREEYYFRRYMIPHLKSKICNHYFPELLRVTFALLLIP